MLDYIGLFVEFLFLALAVYGYLFARGMLKVKDPAVQKRAEEFRQKNKTWLLYGSMLLAAMMLVNIYLHIKDLL